MFARIKKSGKFQYLQIVTSHKELGKVRQQFIATIGRMDELEHEVERFFQDVKMIELFDGMRGTLKNTIADDLVKR